MLKLLQLMLMMLLSLNVEAKVVSTTDTLNQALTAIYNQYKDVTAGKVADYIPELAKVDPRLFGIVIATVDGKFYEIGDVNVAFAIESISKPFVYGLALQDNGQQLITEKVGLNATGHAFNSIIAIEERPDHMQNPLVNAGAIQTMSFIRGRDENEKWQRVLSLFKKLSDGKPYLGDAVYQSETKTNQHNQAIAELLSAYTMMNGSPQAALDRYTKACSIMVTAKQLALMGASLANAGIQPITHERVIATKYVRDMLSEMVVNGLYETSGAWWWRVGIPAKSGVGGGMLAVVPNKMAIVVFSPPLDEAGNSVRGQKVIEALSQRLALHLLEPKHSKPG